MCTNLAQVHVPHTHLQSSRPALFLRAAAVAVQQGNSAASKVQQGKESTGSAKRARAGRQCERISTLQKGPLDSVTVSRALTQQRRITNSSDISSGMPHVVQLLVSTPLVQNLGEGIQVGDEDRWRRAGLHVSRLHHGLLG